MLCEVHRRWTVSGRLVIDDERVVSGERVGRGNGEIAWKPFLTVGARVAKSNCRPLRRVNGFGSPHGFVKTAVATVQVVGPLVAGNLVLAAIDRESGVL